jgi:hypothetical protein
MSRFELADAKKWNSAESQREAGVTKQKFDWLLLQAMFTFSVTVARQRYLSLQGHICIFSKAMVD